MKFVDMPYERVDYDALTKNIQKVTKDFENATSAKEQLEVMGRMDQLTKDALTMVNLAYIRYTINTQDPFYSKEEEYNSQMAPLWEEAMQPFYKALLHSPYRKELEEELGTMLFMRQEFSIKGFAPEITGLMQEEAKLQSEYQKLMGSAEILFQGEKRNLAQMGAFTGSKDRNTRKEAYMALGKFYDSVREQLDTIYDKLVHNRTAQAKALGYDSYVDLAYIRRERSYSVEDVQAFRQQVIDQVVPFVCQLKKEQCERIGVDHITLYDDGYSFADGNATPKGSSEELLTIARKMYNEMSQETSDFIEQMFSMELFDVLPKPGKTTGAYCETIPGYDCPFIFSSFSGTHGDVETLTHEAGHAFADYTAARRIPFMDLRLPTMEGAETHSMSMEFLTAPWHELFFKEDTSKYAYSHLAGALIFLPYGCMVDHMQEICYLHPELTPQQRNEEWMKLEKMYRPYLDLTGIPAYERGAGWQRQLHLYTVPYYYIDYCLAQTVALQFFMASEKDWKNAWERYLDFVNKGGKKDFVSLVKEAGLRSPFEDGCLKEIVSFSEDWFKNHPIQK